jgi:uncharacterized protein YdeI (YjbR/CyaY-like superfamily)
VSDLFRELPVLDFPAAAAWEAWLRAEGATSGPVWLRFAKQGSGATSIAKPAAIESAIAYGWIDGQQQPWDARFWLTRFTRRSKTSRWSQVNVASAERLIAEGRLMPPGLAEVEAARADGRWAAAYAPQSKADVPDDLRRALDADPQAAAVFATLTGANRYAVLYRLGSPKTAKGRAAALERLVAMLARGETFH